MVTPLRRVRIALAAYAAVVGIGTVGYTVLAGVSVFDALYMTIITVATVGYGEVIELDTISRVFTIFLIIAGFGSAAYAALSAAEFVVEGHFRRIIERRRMERRIAQLDRHIIICGFGRVGRHIATELLAEDRPFVVVDDAAHKIEEMDELGYLYIEGDATEEHVLEEAGLSRARAVVATVNTDADNVLIALTARGLRPDVELIGRIKADENEAKLRRAGADRVIAPSSIGGRRIAQLLTRPVVSDFIELVSGPGGVEYIFEEVPVPAGSELDGVTLREAAIRERYGCSVIGIRHAEEDRLDTHPDADNLLHAEDVLIVIGTEDDVAAMRAHFTS